MRRNLKTLAITSVLLVGSLGALTLQAHPGSEGMKQEGSMMGQGMMGQGGMMEHMKQMEKMMENCNKMMEVMLQKMEKQQDDSQQPTQSQEDKAISSNENTNKFPRSLDGVDLGRVDKRSASTN